MNSYSFIHVYAVGVEYEQLFIYTCICSRRGVGTAIHFSLLHTQNCYYIHVLMRDERRKEERSKQSQTNNKVKQHSTPKPVTCM